MSRIVWCLGLYASASTWVFNVARQLAEANGGAAARFVADGIDEADFARADALHIVKSHEIGDDAAVAFLARRSSRILVSVRDPRDAVTSLMVHHGFEFARALDQVELAARLCLRFAGDRRTLLLKYESGFFEDPGTVGRIDAHLGFCTDEAARGAVFEALRRAAVEAYIAALPAAPGVLEDRASGDLMDPLTHWHSHHAGRSGEMGRWRRALPAAQARAVEARLGDWFRGLAHHQQGQGALPPGPPPRAQPLEPGPGLEREGPPSADA